MSSPRLQPGFGTAFADLYAREGLARLDAAFLADLGGRDADLRARLETARAKPGSLEKLAESELLLALAPHLESFLARLFGIEPEVAELRGRHGAFDLLWEVKRNFVQRRALKGAKSEAASATDGTRLGRELEGLMGKPLTEQSFAEAVLAWGKDAAANGEKLAKAEAYAAWAVLAPEGWKRHGAGVLFRQPGKLDPTHLVRHLATRTDEGFARHAIAEGHLRRREGFALTDPGADLVHTLDQANYCIWCHKQGKDSCSTGLREKKDEDAHTPPFRKSPGGVALAGCPLGEKISEFQLLKAEGVPVGALAMIVADNPLAAATGHRICNDCMKSCVYQKQDPVNIPEVETRTLKDVLELPWGFEIYSLLTRWNPLNLRSPLPKPATGRKVLIVGMGPAGFTLAHFLLNDGHAVVGVDGLKIEPLPAEISGVAADGTRVPFQPIRDVRDLRESLDDRMMAGFGGVAEYGITVRWDKNFLKIVRLLLERRADYALFGGVRFGGTITLEQAWAMGFDHVALAAGAGRPTVIEIPNGLARGVRVASDFLMALQLTGAARMGALANMQLRLPAVVIGGGLTAIDTATEALAYYPRQVEKFLARCEKLAAEKGGEAAVCADWDEEERLIADEFLAHARAIRAERARAKVENRPARIVELLRGWGGVTIAYRKGLGDSPSYTLNHEEVEKALEEGISFAEGLAPVAVEVDRFGHAERIVLQRQDKNAPGGAGRPNENPGAAEAAGSLGLGADAPGRRQGDGRVALPARAIFFAAGTQPNITLAREDPVHFPLDGKYFQACDETGKPVKPERASSKPGESRVLLTRADDGRFVSFFGDSHPSYFGNVVKAMGSAKQGYPVVSRVLAARPPASAVDRARFFADLNRELRAVVVKTERLTPTIFEIVLRAPAAARAFHPGQFYRLQNYEALAPTVEGTHLLMEGIALTGAWVDKAKGLISVIVLDMEGSSSLCRLLRPNDPVVLMGPTGTPTEIPSGETVLLAGGGLGNAVLFSIGQALRAAGSKVLYFAGYWKAQDRYKVAEIERAADAIVWCCGEAPGFIPTRPQDRAFTGNIVEAMRAYAEGRLGAQPLAFKDVDRIIAIGSDRMMAAVAAARHDVLKEHLKSPHFAIGSINSPMQCMMKEICAQCLQPTIDPKTGARSYVFSCFNQDQPLDCVDWQGLHARLRQNSVQEKLSARWIARCLERVPKARV
ncbi:MAG: pyridine nucleotide-disulfide oxidoreductase [Rhodospirillales bacterium]|nr:pyridine nucleotide-disulfide oxidoreductase [Rhodospirillales bacterium]